MSSDSVRIRTKKPSPAGAVWKGSFAAPARMSFAAARSVGRNRRGTSRSAHRTASTGRLGAQLPQDERPRVGQLVGLLRHGLADAVAGLRLDPQEDRAVAG